MMSLRIVISSLLLTVSSVGLAAYQATTSLSASSSAESLVNTGERFLPPGTPFIDPNRAQQVKCVNQCGNNFNLPSIGSGYDPKHTSSMVKQSERYQQACLKHCLR